MKKNNIPQKNIKIRWFFPTNTNNLRVIMAQGLIASPEGFSKYYKDILEDCNGFLPVFKNRVPSEHLAKAISEMNNMTPCLLELDLAGMNGQVKAFMQEEKYIDMLLENVTADSVDSIDHILIPLPLPLGIIKSVVFKNKAQVAGFEKDVKTRSDIFLMDVKLQSAAVNLKLFQDPPKEPSIGIKDETKKDSNAMPSTATHFTKNDYKLAYAYGGMLSLLFYYAKNGEASHDVFASFVKAPNMSGNGLEKHRIHHLVYKYFHNCIDKSKAENKMIIGIIDCCLGNDFKNSCIYFLENGSLDEERADRRKMVLAKVLKEYYSGPVRSRSEYFKGAQSDIEKLLLVLFATDDSGDFIDYLSTKISDRTTISEDEHVSFALFLGIRDLFRAIPIMIKKHHGLQQYISYQMANYMHQKKNSAISFKPVKPPLTVWQMIANKMSKHTVKLLKLESCVQTVMPKGNFVHEKGVNIYDGYCEPTYKIIEEKYFKLVSTRIIPDIDYNKLK